MEKKKKILFKERKQDPLLPVLLCSGPGGWLQSSDSGPEQPWTIPGLGFSESTQDTLSVVTRATSLPLLWTGVLTPEPLTFPHVLDPSFTHMPDSALGTEGQ